LGDGNDTTCPEASKVGSVQLTTPLLDHPVMGDVYVRSPTPEHLFRLAIVARLVPGVAGLIVKLPGIAEPDPVTGQITATFTDNPQVPFEEMALTFKGGGRAPLANPVSCGTATTNALLRPWSGNAPIAAVSSFTLTGDCTRSAKFEPAVEAGV